MCADIGGIQTHTRLAETPFSSDRKWMGVLAKPSSSPPSSEGEWSIKGAVEEILRRSASYHNPVTRTSHPLDENSRLRILAATHKMAEEGLRVLAFASGRGEKSEGGDKDGAAKGLTFAGLVGMFDPPRPGVSTSIRRLLQGGVRIIMITGDSATTALSIARLLGIPLPTPHTSAILTGTELDSYTDS